LALRVLSRELGLFSSKLDAVDEEEPEIHMAKRATSTSARPASGRSPKTFVVDVSENTDVCYRLIANVLSILFRHILSANKH